jgi:beta-glucosidase
LVTVSATVTNVGERAGDEVVQLYLRDLLATTAQPVIRLAGFERIALEPGESRVVTFRLGPDDLAILDDTMRRVVEPGTFRVWVGASSTDLRLRGALEVR